MRLAILAGLALGGVLSACQLATDFSLKPIAERDDALCVDGRDDDFDGLTDCQDWNCLGRVPCCDIPEVLLEDDFEDGASCAVAACEEATCASSECGPDPERWHTWPCPIPKVCDGTLRIDKGACYPGGVLSRSTAALGPGLIVATEVIGQPERLGFLEIALTLQSEDDFPGSFDACGRLQPVSGFASARVAWAEGGLQIVALFRELEAGRSAVVPVGDGPHRVVIAVDRERRITYALDGVTFATADVPVPTSDTQVRIALTGLTERAAFARVRVEAGIRCHDPASWTPRGSRVGVAPVDDVVDEADLERAVVLAGDTATPSAFDADEVYHPTLRRDEEDDLEVFYTGCYWPSEAPACNVFGVAIGRAVLAADGTLVRDPDRNPWLVPADLTQGGVNGSDPEVSLAVAAAPERTGYVPLFAGQAKSLLTLDDALAPVGEALGAADQGSWDEAEVCCATAADGPDGVRRIWYAGRGAATDKFWRIGVATSQDGATFARLGEEPVLSEGPPEAFDGGGVTNPTVIYDEARGIYRMWYEGHDFFGKVTIGYAVSTDGARWSRFPGNPVITPEQLGLVTIGGPAVERAPDGRLLMLVHGTTVGVPRRRIFALTNDGSVVETP